MSNMFFQCCGRSKMATNPLTFPSGDVVYLFAPFELEGVGSDVVPVSMPQNSRL